MPMRSFFIYLILLAGISLPSWGKLSYPMEVDSSAAVKIRIERDFPYTVDEFYNMVKAENPRYTRAELEADIKSKKIETKKINGSLRVFRKALRNMKLEGIDKRKTWKGRGASASAARRSYVDSIVSFYHGNNKLGEAHKVKYRFAIDVPVTEELVGDTIKVWMPVPLTSARQQDVSIVSTSQPDFILSGDRSVHNSIYFQQLAKELGDTMHFWYEAEFVTRGQHFPIEKLYAAIKEYDKSSPLYKAYTSFENPHIVRLDELARSIVGDEKNPVKQSEMVFDYIVANYPWAGAREYSTIDCIPEYVIKEGHGDCGQVSLLYISLMRTLGVPARWESGWMLHPGEKNLHDWAEVYFEGVGWVPVDVSFGRYSSASNKEIRNFYSHGMDSHRLAANRGVGGRFYPSKRFIRSETVDAQMGEVETTKGNLFYPNWDMSLKLISVEPTEFKSPKSNVGTDLNLSPTDNMGLISIPVASIRTEPAHKAEISTQGIMGTPVRILEKKDGWLHVQTPEGYKGWVPDSSVAEKTPDEFSQWRMSQDRRIATGFWQDKIYSDPYASGPRDIISDIVLGTIVEIDPEANFLHNNSDRVAVILPDGRRGWTSASLTPLSSWADQEFDADKILDTAYSMEGTPYLWGGMSTKALDCSGLVKVSYTNNGRILLRDASQQAKTGQQLDPAEWRTFMPGDLLFFGNASTGRVTHVGIYDSDGMYVHSSGRVKRNSLDPSHPDYLYSPIKAVRINGMEGTEGIIRACEHPWFFIFE